MTDVFVYGTLRKHALLPDLYYLPNHTMYNAGHFPYILPEGDGKVYGQLIRDADEIAMADMDRYESVDTGLYYRTTATVYNVETNEPLEVEVYIGKYIHPSIIESGDWNVYKEEAA